MGRKIAFMSGHVHKSNGLKDVTEFINALNFVASKTLNEMSVIELNSADSDKWNRWRSRQNKGDTDMCKK